MDFSELASVRQSERKYLDKPVERNKIIRCLETARLSPSACNSQPWRFIVVDNPDLRAVIGECASSLGMNKFVAQAPVIVAVVMEKMNMLSKIGSVLGDKEYNLIDIGIAVNQFCLQARDLGLGTCIVGMFDEKRVKRLLDVSSSRRVPLLITVGYTDNPLRPKQRKTLEQISGWNRY